jgi:hypothetical protein
MSPQEKRHGVMARIRTSDLTIERPTLYHLSYPARQFLKAVTKQHYIHTLIYLINYAPICKYRTYASVFFLFVKRQEQSLECVLNTFLTLLLRNINTLGLLKLYFGNNYVYIHVIINYCSNVPWLTPKKRQF